MQRLDSLGLSEDTIIAFWSDHGISMGENSFWGKFKAIENVLRVPLILKIPGVSDGGMASSSLVELVDIFPTLAEAAGDMAGL